MARYFPIFVDLQDCPCLIVGAGEIATHKADQLLKYGAKLTIVAPEATDTVKNWADEGKVVYLARPFQTTDVDGKRLVVGSTDSSEVNKAVFEAASARGIMANIVDVPELCNFIYGALVERGDLQIAISTSGRSPAYAGHLRRELEEIIGPEYAQYVDILGEARQATRRHVSDLEAQKRTYQRILELDLLSLIRQGEGDEARRRAIECISQSSD